MVNAGLANGGDSRFPPPLFREFLPVFGQIPHIQNPFKYKRIREINPKTAHPASRPPQPLRGFPLLFRNLSSPQGSRKAPSL